MGNRVGRILVDLDRLKSPYNGLGRFALHFGKALAKACLHHPDLKLTYLVPPSYLGFFGQEVQYELADWKRRYFSRFLKTYDLWHAIHQDSPFMPSSPRTLYLLTIHDLNFLKEKKRWKARLRLARLQKKVNRAHAITTISEFSKNTIQQNLALNVPIHLIYNGIELQKPLNEKSPFSFQEKMILGIGVVQPKKNWEVLVDWMGALPPDYRLVIAGNHQTAYARYLTAKIQKKRLEPRIQFIGEVTEEQKYYLLRDCYAFVFPSKLEGMGMPPLEAMSLGKPVFVFPYTSIPEFCKEFAYYWQDENPLAMASFFLEKMKEFHSQPSLPNKMIEYVQQFSWQNTAQRYMELYRKMLGI